MRRSQAFPPMAPRALCVALLALSGLAASSTRNPALSPPPSLSDSLGHFVRAVPQSWTQLRGGRPGIQFAGAEEAAERLAALRSDGAATPEEYVELLEGCAGLAEEGDPGGVRRGCQVRFLATPLPPLSETRRAICCDATTLVFAQPQHQTNSLQPRHDIQHILSSPGPRRDARPVLPAIERCAFARGCGAGVATLGGEPAARDASRRRNAPQAARLRPHRGLALDLLITRPA